jgi:hypothetical protein
MKRATGSRLGGEDPKNSEIWEPHDFLMAPSKKRGDKNGAHRVTAHRIDRRSTRPHRFDLFGSQ